MRRTLTSLAALLLAVSAAPLSGIVTAHAANITAACGADLTTELAAANPGDVITLTGGALCTGAYTLKTGVAITLQGATSADGFDGGGTNTSLTGVDNGTTTIRNLVFKHGMGTLFGGAIRLSGNVFPTITGNTFLDNAGGSGGAVNTFGSTIGDGVTITNNIFGSAGHPNTATGAGGAITASAEGVMTITDNVFDSNTGASVGGAILASSFGAGSALDFSRNQILNNSLTGSPFGASGGGAFLQVAGNVTLNANVFRNNSIPALRAQLPTNLGGGLEVRQLTNGDTLTQSHNLFVGNSLGTAGDTNQNPTSSFDFGGGGEYAQVGAVNSLDDVFTNNSVGDAGVHTTPIGGGIAIQGFGGNKVTLKATNLVLTNNRAGASGEGGGAYGGFANGCAVPPCTAEIDLFDSTVDGNAVGAGGTGSGLGGNPTDTANVANSIVFGNTGNAKQVDGFGTIAVNRSDSCQSAGVAYAGTGNLCVDPQLANVPGNDVHETTPSLTIDAGDTALVPAGVASDFEGDARVQGARVDIGADEFAPAVVVPTLPQAGTIAPTAPVPVGALVLLILAAALVLGGLGSRTILRSTN